MPRENDFLINKWFIILHESDGNLKSVGVVSEKINDLLYVLDIRDKNKENWPSVCFAIKDTNQLKSLLYFKDQESLESFMDSRNISYV